MRKYEKYLEVPKDVIDRLEAYMNAEPGQYPNIINRKGYAIFDEEVVFDDGYRAVIQVIPPTDEDSSTAWCQGVLFNPGGGEVFCTVPCEDLKGEWHLYCGGDEYIVNVQPV